MKKIMYFFLLFFCCKNNILDNKLTGTWESYRDLEIIKLDYNRGEHEGTTPADILDDTLVYKGVTYKGSNASTKALEVYFAYLEKNYFKVEDGSNYPSLERQTNQYTYSTGYYDYKLVFDFEGSNNKMTLKRYKAIIYIDIFSGILRNKYTELIEDKYLIYNTIDNTTIVTNELSEGSEGLLIDYILNAEGILSILDSSKTKSLVNTNIFNNKTVYFEIPLYKFKYKKVKQGDKNE